MKEIATVLAGLIAGMAAIGSVEEDGGQFVRKGSFSGRIAIVDTQSVLPFTEVQSVATQLVAFTKFNVIAVRHSSDKPLVLKDALKAQVVVAIIDDPNAPIMLVAPEEHWGQVNVARIADDVNGIRNKSLIRNARARKEIVRAFSLLCGGGSSQFAGNVMNAATMEELDDAVESIPVDMVEYYRRHLKNFGVTPKETVSYAEACQEGWAPAPTNAVQKKIWDEIHSIPKSPIRITP